MVEVESIFEANPKYREGTQLTEKVGYWSYKIIIPKQSTKDRIMSETSNETKQKAKDYGNSLVMKQTAVEWLENELGKNPMPHGNRLFINKAIKQAKEMEKEQDKKLYSEEEVEKLIRITYEETMRAMVDWFVNNKDKNQEEMESAIENYVYPRLEKKGIKFKKNVR